MTNAVVTNISDAWSSFFGGRSSAEPPGVKMKSWLSVRLCTLLLLSAIVCVSGLVRFRQYSWGPNWWEARQLCRKWHTDLISIKTSQDIEKSRDYSGWIGLYRESNDDDWKWSHGDETVTNYNWDFDQPERNEHCGFKQSGKTKWRNDKCSDSHPFTCYDETMFLVKELKTWEEALDHCRSLGVRNSSNSSQWLKRYDLASLTSEEEHLSAQELAQQASTEEVWTGLRHLGDSWFWVGGEAVQYQDIPSCPAGRCGVLEKSGSGDYDTRDCSERRNFLCYLRSDSGSDSGSD